MATSSPHSQDHLADDAADNAGAAVAVPLRPPSQGPSRHTSFMGARSRQEPEPAADEQRTVDTRHSRAAYLGQWRQTCRGIFDVISEPNNADAVDDLRCTILRRWELYASAHRVYLAEAELPERKVTKLNTQHDQHAQENDDAIRTLEAYLRREMKAMSRIEVSTPRHTQRRSPIAIERLPADELEIDRLRQSVAEIEARLQETRERIVPRDQSTPFDVFGIQARQAALQQKTSRSLPPRPTRAPEAVRAATRRSPAGSLPVTARTPPRRTPPRLPPLDTSATQVKARATPTPAPRPRQGSETQQRRRETRELEQYLDGFDPLIAANNDGGENRGERSPRSQVGRQRAATPASSVTSRGYSLSVSSTPARADQVKQVKSPGTAEHQVPATQSQRHTPRAGSHASARAAPSPLQGGAGHQAGTNVQAAAFVPQVPTTLAADVRQQFQQQVASLAADVKVPASTAPPTTQYQPNFGTNTVPYDFAAQAQQSHNQVQANTSQVMPAFGLTSAPVATATAPQPSASAAMDIVSMMMLPRPKLLTFDGSPLKWNAFVQNFTANVAMRVQDPQLRMQYLLQHCTGDAFEHIKECALLPQDIAYERAVALLKQRFGAKHTVARSYIKELTGGPRVAANDVDGLVKFASKLRGTLTVMSQLSYGADLNAHDTLKACVARLPSYLSTQWAKKYGEIVVDEGRDPSIYDFTKFVERSAALADTEGGREQAASFKDRYGSDAAKKAAKAGAKQQDAKPQPKVTTLATETKQQDKQVKSKQESQSKASNKQVTASTQNQPSGSGVNKPSSYGGSDKSSKSCPVCDSDNHRLLDCRKFQQMTVPDRVNAVMRAGRCFRCLQAGHMARECDKVCKKCERRHHSLLHDTSRDKPGQSQQSASVNTLTRLQPVGIRSSQDQEAKVWMETLPVILHGVNGIIIKTYAMLDSGSTTSLMNKRLFLSLGVPHAKVDYTIRTITADEPQSEQVEGVVVVSNLDKSEQVKVKVTTVDDLVLFNNGSMAQVSQWKHLKNIKTDAIPTNLVGILIGSDCAELRWTLDEVRGGRGEPFARKTLLGWTISGPAKAQNLDDWTPTTRQEQAKQPNVSMDQALRDCSWPPDQCDVYVLAVDRLEKQLQRQWNADFGDLDQVEREAMSQDDKRAVDIMTSTVQMVDNKYKLAIPWKFDPATLPNNRRCAETRLRSLARKFAADAKLREQYTATVTKYIADGHARKLKASELDVAKPQWYLPHHPVFKRSNPSKCRVVFDCAATYNGVALNDAILQGPNYLNSLAGVLMRFRKERVAVVGDIEAMFHQCYVTDKDQAFLRFLWWEDGDTSKPHQVFCMKVHLFGATSSPSVAHFCMKKTAVDNANDFSVVAVDTLKRGFYVDDMLKSVATPEAASALIKEMVSLLARGGFKLAKFASTSRQVMDTVPEEDRAKSFKTIDLTDSTLPQDTALGLQWSIEADSFLYDVDLPERELTKRGLLSITASLYDPLGFVGPVVLVPKMTQQELCRRQIEWDDAIPADLLNDVKRWLSAVPELRSMRIPRCIKPSPGAGEVKLELHTFCDASEFAYGAAVYARSSNSHDVKVSLLMGKSRVAPLKTLSIPRLELTAAVVAVKLHRFVLDELDAVPSASWFWTDSMTVLRYIENTSSRYKTFVAHRIEAIHEATRPEQWNYVPTELNPADHASRGVHPGDSKRLTHWLFGPGFLADSVADWRDKFIKPAPSSDESEPELKPVYTTCTGRASDSLLMYYSSYHRLLKAVAWLHKFSQHRRHQQPSKHLTVKDLELAEKAVIRYIQHHAFPEEVRRMRKQEPVATGSALVQLDPFIDEHGLIRVGGRLNKCTAVVEKHPIVLPRHHVTDTLIRELHEANAHAGCNQTLAQLAKKFWVITGYSVVKSVLRRCIGCRKHHGKVGEQKMSDLPAARVAVDLPPFTNVGVDYFGPVNTKYRRGTVKRWVCLFTCLVTRAIHLEIAFDMSADSFLMAFHRFTARRGKPAVVYSDNGSNFVAAERELRDELQAINSERVKATMLLEAIDWHFTPPYAPHMGGVWERMVQSVKSTLKALITTRLLTDEELLSFIAEAERVINDRPLTKMRSDPRDPTPLSPSDLLLLRGNPSSSPIAESNPLRRRWAIVQDLANTFYKRFLSEYLSCQQARSKWQQDRPPLQINDIVLVADEDLPRGQWPLGLVVEVITSEDGRVRSARVRVAGKERLRSTDKLVYLEHCE